MNKNKTKKALATLAIAGMAMTMTPFNAFADNGITTARLFGSDRVGTAVTVANAGWTTADTVILAPMADANLVDALAAAPLAGKTSPVLLTDNSTLTDATKAEITKLGAKKVYVVGAITQTVVDQVNAIPGVTATLLKGSDRTVTAAAIAAKLTNPAGSFIVGYGALADALSVASYAAANNYSILVANPDGSLPASEAAYKGANVYILGGPTLVGEIAGATRLFGADRFETNQKVLKQFTYTYNKAYVANGTDAHLVDSLVASSLAAQTNSPIVLADTDSALAAADVNAKLAANAVVTALGGTTVVTDAVVQQIVTGNTTPPPTSAPVTIDNVAVSGQKVGTGTKVSPAVGLVNSPITVSSTVNGASAANASITYLVTSSDNITGKDSNGNTLVDTTLNSPIIIGNDTFKASYTVPADAYGKVKATFTSTASSQETFNVVIEAPFSNSGAPVKSDVASIEWGAPGTMVLSPVYKSSNPDSLNFSTSGAGATKGLVAVVATMLPAEGSTTAVTGQAVKFTMTNGGNSTSNANAFYTDATGTTMLASGAVVGKGGTSSVTYVANTDANGQALVYINSNLPADNGVASLGSMMDVGVQAQLVNGGGSSTTGYYEWKAVSQPAKIANVSPSAMLNPTGVEGGGTVVNDSAETATSGSTMTISGTLQDAAGNPVKNTTVAIQDYDVKGSVGSNNVQNDAFVASDGTTKLFSAVDYPTVTTDSNGNWSVKVTANIPVTQSIQSSVTRYYAFYVPPTIAISAGQSLPNTVTRLTFVGNSNSADFIDLVWQQGQTAQTIGVSHTSLMPTYASLSAVPQTMTFANVVGDDEELYAAAYNQTGTIIAPAAGNQFDAYALTYDLTAPAGIHFNKLGTVALPVKTSGTETTGMGRMTATYSQVKGFVLTALYYADGTVYYSNGANNVTAVTPSGFDPSVYANAYDGSGQLHFYVNSDQTSAVVASGNAGSLNVNMNAYSNTSSTGEIDKTHAQGSASGTINASFTASNTISSLGLVGDLSGIYNYNPLQLGNAAPSSTLSVAGTASDDWTSSNASFIVAPFNSYPAMATIPTQGVTMNLTATKTGLFRYIDGYKLASKPSNVSVNVNSLGEVSVNNVKIWTAASGYKVVGYSSTIPADGITASATTVLEQSTTDPLKFMAVNLADSSTTALSLDDAKYLAGNFEGYLGFKTIGGQLQPLVAGYYSDNNAYAPASGVVSDLADMVFAPVLAVQANVSDKYSESPIVTISNSLNSQTATATVGFTSTTGGLVAIKANPASVNGVFGSSQTITLTAQDQYGNPLPNQTLNLPSASMNGLWITQVNGQSITTSVNMGSNSSTSMQSVLTPVPLFVYSAEGLTNKPAYDTISFAGITAYNLNTANRTISLVTGVDGTVSITLQNGNVTYPCLAGTDTATTRSYDVDGGRVINGKLDFTNGSGSTIGSVTINWAGRAAGTTPIAVTGITVTGAATVVNGQTLQLTSAVLPANATDSTVAWSVAPGTGTATINASTGLLTATGVGTVTVTAKNVASGVSTTKAITVTAVGAKTLTGTFSTLLGQPYCKVTLPATGSQTVTSVTVDGATKVSGTDYAVSAGVVNILNVTAANAITVTTADGTYTIN